MQERKSNTTSVNVCRILLEEDFDCTKNERHASNTSAMQAVHVYELDVVQGAVCDCFIHLIILGNASLEVPQRLHDIDWFVRQLQSADSYCPDDD